LLKDEKFFKTVKQMVKKVYYDKDLYPTDFRKKHMSAERGLINFFMRGGNFQKVKAILRRTYSNLYELLLFRQPLLLRKQYKFFETLGQIILHDNT
jgi:hypothetical protein